MLYKLPIIIMSNLLCAGGPYNAMFFLFRILVATLAYFIPETCEAIYNALKDRYLKVRKKKHKFYSLFFSFFLFLSCNIFNFNDQFFIFAIFLYQPLPPKQFVHILISFPPPGLKTSKLQLFIAQLALALIVKPVDLVVI